MGAVGWLASLEPTLRWRHPGLFWVTFPEMEMYVPCHVLLNETQKPFEVAMSSGGVCVDRTVAERLLSSLRLGTFADFCLRPAEMKHGAASRVISVAAIQHGDTETLGFDCRLVCWAQEALPVLIDRDIK